jgi:pyrroloquinoline quinone (PQQ) biosynthesis protein C
MSAAELTRPPALTDIGQATLRRLMREWFEFERRLAMVPIIKRLDLGTFTREDYQRLLLNLRPQVVEGSRWISRCASSFDRDHADIRSVILRHAHDEHRDYEVLEEDFVAAGGERAVIRAQARNPGSEALHAFLMFKASEPNPGGMLGAMWIIEGLGEKMAANWAGRIEDLTGFGSGCTRFLRYHANNDQSHMDKLYGLIDRICMTQRAADDVVTTATVVARLYAWQLEEIDGGR